MYRGDTSLGLAAFVGVSILFTLIFVLFASGRGTPMPAFPDDLQSTGLYSDFSHKTIDPRNLSYSPQYPLWSDGAVKRRWIYLPPGTAIDASDPDIWLFPD